MESVFVLTVWSTCGCICLFVIPATSASQSGSIKSQLVDVCTSHGNIVSLIDEIGELQFEGLVACGATQEKLTSNCADPARLPGRVNGPAREPGLANGE